MASLAQRAFLPTLTVNTLVNAAMIALFLTVRTYMDKLHRTGCACADHPYAKFVRVFPVIAAAYLVVHTLFPFLMTSSQATLAIVLAITHALFALAAVVFFVYAIQYARFLIREKCKCSEDLRRELMMYWSIVLLALIVVSVVLTLSAASTATGALTAVVSRKGAIASALTDPVRSLKGATKSLSRRASRS